MPEEQTTTQDRAALPEPTNGERLVRAILDHRVVEFVYRANRRTVEP